MLTTKKSYLKIVSTTILSFVLIACSKQDPFNNFDPPLMIQTQAVRIEWDYSEITEDANTTYIIGKIRSYENEIKGAWLQRSINTFAYNEGEREQASRFSFYTLADCNKKIIRFYFDKRFKSFELPDYLESQDWQPLTPQMQIWHDALCKNLFSPQS